MFKQLPLFAIISAVLYLTACNSQNQTATGEAVTQATTVSQPPNIEFSKSFEGNIDGKYAVTMQLTRSGDELSGTYAYTKVGKAIILSGSINKKGDFSISELDDNGNITGVFEGRLTSTDEISGNWSKPDRSKLLPFSLHEKAEVAQNNADQTVEVVEEILSLKGKDGMSTEFYLPVVKGNIETAALKKINEQLSVKSLTDEALADLKTTYAECNCGTVGSSYDVNFNRHSILDITVFIETLGAYPSGYAKRLTFNTQTGERLIISQLLKPESLSKLAAQCNQQLQERIKTTLKETAAGDEGEWVKELLQDKKFDVEHLQHFTVSEEGISFYYPFGFPHVAQALEPDNAFHFTFNELKEYIHPGGLLAEQK